MPHNEDMPLTPAQARQKLQKGVEDYLAGHDTGPIVFRLKWTKKASHTYPLKLTQQQRETLLEHEVLFEGSPLVDPKAKYPLCLEGERACPPEDCGGVWGYGDFLEAIRNPKHEEHESMLEWIGGRFDPEEFDAKEATKAMRKGLPDWRS